MKRLFSHILAPLEISVAQKSALIAYYRSIPVLDCRALIDGAILAYNQMYGEHIMLSQLMDQKRLLPEAPLERARPFLHHEEEPRLFSERLQERLMHCCAGRGSTGVEASPTGTAAMESCHLCA